MLNLENAVKLARRYMDLDPLIFDTETTGLGPGAEVCDIAVVDKSGAVLFESLIRPVGKIEPGAAAITGINDETVANAPTISDVLPQLRKLIRGRVIGAYNADYDFRVLHTSICARCAETGARVDLLEFDAVFDIIRIGALYYGEYSAKYGGFKNKKLIELAERVGLAPDETLHRARADAILTARVLEKIAADSRVPIDTAPGPETVAELAEARLIIDKLSGDLIRYDREISETRAPASIDFPRRVREIIQSNPYLLTRSDWVTVYNFLRTL